MKLGQVTSDTELDTTLVGGLPEAPINGTSYARKDGAWVSAAGGGAHASTHVTGGGDTIANAVAAGNAGLMSGTDKTKLDGIAAGATVGADWNTNVTNKPTLGTAAAKNIPASGNASATEVVYGSDTRLSDTRTPAAHTHPESEVTSLVADLAAKQAGDATLTALAALDATVGLLEETGADTFTKRALGVGASTSIPTRADADTRYAAASHSHAESEVTSLVADLAAKELAANKGIASGYASLNSSTLVVENPANATAVATASMIPIAGTSGTLDSAWIPDLSDTYAKRTLPAFLAKSGRERFLTRIGKKSLFSSRCFP